MAIFSGFSSNGVPYAKLSDSGPALVVLMGSELEHQPPSWTAQQGFLVGLKQLTKNYSIYLMNRKPNLPRGYTAQDMSDDFAEMIRKDIGTSVHLMGMSKRIGRISISAWASTSRKAPYRNGSHG